MSHPTETQNETQAVRRSGRIDSMPILILYAHSSCNCRCVMCDIWKTSESTSFSPEALARCLPAIRLLGVRWVVLSGGEPLLNPDWPLVCRMLKDENIRITILTTGLLLEKYAGEIPEHCDEVIVSLDGPEPVHDEIRQLRKAFSLLQRGVSAVRDRAPQFRITARTTVQKVNRLHLKSTVDAASMLRLNGISFLAADLTSRAFNRPQPWPLDRQLAVGLSVEEIQELQEEVESLIQSHRAEIASGFIAESPDKLRRIVHQFRVHLGLARAESPICNAPWVSSVIETDGTVRPCFFHRSIGNLGTLPLEEIVNGQEAASFRSGLDIANNPTCNRCVCSLNYRG
jgi:Fe-coproporphyrin III synthase